MELSSPTSGFDDPIAMLVDCHHRIAGFCDTLERLGEHLSSHGVDMEARVASGRIITYFDQAVPHHHADEETDLLPVLRMRANGFQESQHIIRWSERLMTDHRVQDALWQALRRDLEKIQNGEFCPIEIAKEFIAHEREHINFENHEVFPLARILLISDDFVKIGRAMAARRGMPFPGDM